MFTSTRLVSSASPLAVACALVCSLPLLAPQSASAQPAAAPPPPPVAVVADFDPPPSLSVTVSPVHLLIGVFEGAAELRLSDNLGLAAIGGIGSVEVLDERVTVYELGTQLNYYFGRFEGFHVGAEAMYIGATAELDGVTGTAEGLSLGAMGGYKWISQSGLTLVAQLGVQNYVIRAEASDGSSTANDEDSRTAALLNLNAGWSF